MANNTGLPSPPVGSSPKSPQLHGNGFSNNPGPIIGALTAVLVAVLVAGLFIFKRRKSKTGDIPNGLNTDSPRLRHPEDTEGSFPTVTWSLNDKEVYVIESKEYKHSPLANEALKKTYDVKINIDDVNHLIRNPHLPIPHFQLYLSPHAVVEEALGGSIPGSPYPQSPHALRYQAVVSPEAYRDFTRSHGPNDTNQTAGSEAELPLEHQFALLMVQQQNLERIRQEQEAGLRRVRARLLAERKDTHETEGEEGYRIQEGWLTAATVSWPRPPGDNSQVIDIPEEVKSREIVLGARQQEWSTEAAVSWPRGPESRVIEISEKVEESADDGYDSTTQQTYVPRSRRALFPLAFPLAYKHAFDKKSTFPVNPALKRHQH
ncbi:hypothetical protein BGZ81_000190 [Podila clonocystis]|nr:hypothetical protein BGZ81_000190 [Podila clonocystis]